MFVSFQVVHSQMLKHTKESHQSNARRRKSTSLFPTPSPDAHANNGIRQRKLYSNFVEKLISHECERDKDGNIF
jgi:hypothetical protein